MADITQAKRTDLQEILNLQYLAYQSEARLLNNTNIPPLMQTITDTAKDYDKGIILKLVEDDKVVGSVRGISDGDTTYVGKLMVHPDYQMHGYGTRLLIEIEKYFSTKRFELFTSVLSQSNIKLYERNGYKIFDTKKVSDKLTMVYLEKFK